jgi:hypothetical protein
LPRETPDVEILYFGSYYLVKALIRRYSLEILGPKFAGGWAHECVRDR